VTNEPGAAVLSIFDQLIERIKQRTPTRTDGKPVNSMVYSQLVLGMPIWKDDYFRPWSPAGGSSLMQSLKDNPVPAVAAPAGAGAAPAPALDPLFLRSMQAAFKTSLLCRTMLQVTKDGAYREYPTGRHLDFAYDSVINSMQPAQAVEIAADVKARVEAAQKVLYVEDAEGNLSNTPLYNRYLNNAQALATAKSNFAAAFALAQRDPVKFEVWPVQSASYQLAVDTARNNLISQGALKVEAAMDVIGSVGRSMQANMIKKARQRFDEWNLGLSGAVPSNMPYSLILPTNWCDGDDHQGWESLVVDEGEIQHYSSSNASSASASSWQRHAESSGGSGGVLLGFAAFGGSHGSASENSSFQNSNSSSFHSSFKNTAKGLHIELEFGLCKIERPWLVSDVFYVKDWYSKGNKKNSISDGTIDGQADSMEKLLPMIPQQFLVVRNVSITASEWGSDGEMFENYYGANSGSQEASASRTAGSAGVCLGFISFGGSASHSSSDASGQSSGFQSRSGSSHFGATWNNQTLRIPGAQIVAFLSSIVPACPGADDPELGK
jgi:hypothetical protein